MAPLRGIPSRLNGASRSPRLRSAAATFPAGPFPETGRLDPPNQCLAISAWATLLFGVLLPLLLLHEGERRERRRRREAAAAAAAAAQEQRRAGAPAPRRGAPSRQPALEAVPEEASSSSSSSEGQEQPSEDEGGEEDGGPLPLPEAAVLLWGLRPYFYSMLAWSAVALMLHALPLAVGGAAGAAGP